MQSSVFQRLSLPGWGTVSIGLIVIDVEFDGRQMPAKRDVGIGVLDQKAVSTDGMGGSVADVLVQVAFATVQFDFFVRIGILGYFLTRIEVRLLRIPTFRNEFAFNRKLKSPNINRHPGPC